MNGQLYEMTDATTTVTADVALPSTVTADVATVTAEVALPSAVTAGVCEAILLAVTGCAMIASVVTADDARLLSVTFATFDILPSTLKWSWCGVAVRDIFFTHITSVVKIKQIFFVVVKESRHCHESFGGSGGCVL